MLLKLALRNFLGRKAYYASYIGVLSVGLAIIYSLHFLGSSDALFRALEESGQFGVLSKLFAPTEVIVAITVVIFMMYICRFFIKQRTDEISLYKLTGLSRNGIAALIAIENGLICLFGLIFGCVFSFFGSSFIGKIAELLMGIDKVDYQLVFSFDSLYIIFLVALIIWLLMTLISLPTIYRSSIAQLFLDKDKNQTPVKGAWISGIISIVLFIIGFVFISSAYFLPTLNIITFIGLVALFVTAIFLFYRGFITLVYHFSKQSKRYLKSPSKLIVNGHVSSQSKRVFKVLSLTTICMTGVLFLLFNFYSIRTMIADSLIGNEAVPIQIVNTTDGEDQRIKAIFDDEKMTVTNSSRVSAIVYREDGLVGENKAAEEKNSGHGIASEGEEGIRLNPEDDFTEEVANGHLLIMTKNQFNQFVADMAIDASKTISEQVTDSQTVLLGGTGATVYNLDLVKALTATDTIVNTDNGNRLFGYVSFSNGFKEADLTENIFREVFVFGGIAIVSEANYEAIINENKNNITPFTVSSFKLDADSYYNTTEKINGIYQQIESIVGSHNIMNFMPLAVVSVLMIYGLVQFLFLIIAIILMLTFAITLFFRAIESQELTKENYKIASKLGMTDRDIIISLCKENFNIFILPLLISSALSIIAFLLSMSDMFATGGVNLFELIIQFILPLALIFGIIYVIVISIGYRNIKRLKI